MDKPIRHGETYYDTIIELHGDLVIHCTFVRCEFVGRATEICDCLFYLNVNSPQANTIAYCAFDVSYIPKQTIGSP